MKRLLGCAALSLFLLSVAPRDARADVDGLLGARLGLTDDPTTLQVGIFYEMVLAQAGSGFFAIEPGADIGFDLEDDVSFWTLRGTVNGKYLIPVNNLLLYPIFGLSLWYVNADCGRGDCDNTEAGVNIGAGLRVNQFNFELTVGVDDIPDLFFSVGFLFG
jgi:hypothetical protein